MLFSAAVRTDAAGVPAGRNALLDWFSHAYITSFHLAGSSQRFLTPPTGLSPQLDGGAGGAGILAKNNALLRLLYQPRGSPNTAPGLLLRRPTPLSMRTVASRTRRALLSDGDTDTAGGLRERQRSPKTTQPADGVSFANVQLPLPRGPPLRGRGLLCSAAGGLRWPAFPQGEIALLGLLIHSHVLALHLAGSSQRPLTLPSTLPSPPGGDTDAAGVPAKTNALLELLPLLTSWLSTSLAQVNVPLPCPLPCLLHQVGTLTQPALPRKRTLSWDYSPRPRPVSVLLPAPAGRLVTLACDGVSCQASRFSIPAPNLFSCGPPLRGRNLLLSAAGN